MVDVNQLKIRLVLSLLLPMFLVLVSGVSIALADGEDPFEGRIEEIKKIDVSDAKMMLPKVGGKNYTHTMTVTVTDPILSKITAGSKISFFIADDARILKIKKNGLKAVSIENLSAGSQIRIKPNTLPGNYVEADTIKIIRRAKR